MTTTGLELILPFLRPIQHLILDSEISEIMVNGPDNDEQGNAIGTTKSVANDCGVLPRWRFVRKTDDA